MTIGFPNIADALSLQSLFMAQSPTALSVQPGPSTSVRYCMVDGYGLYRWYLNDTTTANGTTVVAASGGSVGRWKLVASLPSAVEGLTADIAVTSNVASLSGSITHDGITPPNGADALLTAQSTTTENGLWTINTSGAWTRSTKWDSATDTRLASIVRIIRGTTNGGSTWLLTSPVTGTITPGSTAQTWTKIANEVADKAKLDNATWLPTASTLAYRDGSGVLYQDSILGVDRTSAGASGTNLVFRPSQVHSSDLGDWNNGHFVWHHGLCALNNSQQASKDVHTYGDSRAGYAEGVWFLMDNGPVGQAGWDTGVNGERTPRSYQFGTLTNPTTGKGTKLALFSQGAELSLEGYDQVSTSVQAYNGKLVDSWATHAATNSTSADGSGGSIEHINRQVTTTDKTTLTTLWTAVSGEMTTNQLGHCEAIVEAWVGGDLYQTYRFVFLWRGGVGLWYPIQGIVDLVNYPLVQDFQLSSGLGHFYASRAGDGSAQGIVTVSDSGGLPYIKVNGWSAKTVKWFLFLTVHKTTTT